MQTLLSMFGIFASSFQRKVEKYLLSGEVWDSLRVQWTRDREFELVEGTLSGSEILRGS